MKAVGNKKYCPTCKETKSITEYYKSKQTPDNLCGVCMLCHRDASKKYEKSEKGRITALRKAKRMHRKFPEKMRAREKLRYAVYSGKIARPEKCDNCSKSCIPDGHHEDYSEPYTVDWLCDPCHKLKHGKLIDLTLVREVSR